MVKSTEGQARGEKLFPAVARWVRDGHVEVGDQETFGFVARALDYGGLAFEDDRPDTPAEALAVLESGLARWFREQWVEVEQSRQNTTPRNTQPERRSPARPSPRDLPAGRSNRAGGGCRFQPGRGQRPLAVRGRGGRTC
jgi:hypothetical protein